MIPELVGSPSMPVVRKGATREDFWNTVQSIAGHAADGDDLVVLTPADGELPPGEQVACAIRFRSDAGLQVESVGTVAAPRTHGVDVATAVRFEYRNSGRGKAPPPAVVVLEEPRRPRGIVTPGTRALRGLASWLAEQTAGSVAVLVDPSPDEPAYFAEVRLATPVRLHGPWTALLPSGPDARPIPSAGDSEMLHRVSEGAYVPWPTYRESLGSRWRFEADLCGHCGQLSFPARGHCPKCGATEGLIRRLLSRKNLEVCASTVIHPGAQPTEFDPQVSASGPFSVVLVELAPGVRATLQLAEAGSDPVPIGTHVDTQLRRLYPMEGHWRYGRKAVRQP